MQKTDCHQVERKQKNKATAKDKQKKNNVTIIISTME